MTTIKKNRTIITIDKVGKFFEIKRITAQNVITTHAKNKKEIQPKIDFLLRDMTTIREDLGVKI